LYGSFFATLKKELVHRKSFKTREEAKLAIIEYIIRYNPKRLHSSLDDMPPMEYESYYMDLQNLLVA